MALGRGPFGGSAPSQVPQLNIARTRESKATKAGPNSARGSKADVKTSFNGVSTKCGPQTTRDRASSFSGRPDEKRPALRETKFNLPMMKSTVPRPFHFATDERAKRPKAKPSSQNEDDEFEADANCLFDIRNMVEIPDPVNTQARTNAAGVVSQTELFPSRTGQQQREVRWSLAPCSGTTNVLTEFNRSLSGSANGAGSAKRAAKRAADEPSPQPLQQRQHKHARPSASPSALTREVHARADSAAAINTTSLAQEQVQNIHARHQSQKIEQWMKESERHNKAALGYMESMVTANREKAEAVAATDKALTQVENLKAALDEAKLKIKSQQSTIQTLQSTVDQLQTEKQQPAQARGSADFGEDDDWCKKMGISDDESEDEDDCPIPMSHQQMMSGSLTPQEYLGTIRMVLSKQFGERGARRAFAALGEQGGNIAKQSFIHSLDAIMPDMRCKDKTAVWEMLAQDAGLKNGALYFEAFSRIFFQA